MKKLLNKWADEKTKEKTCEHLWRMEYPKMPDFNDEIRQTSSDLATKKICDKCGKEE